MHIKKLIKNTGSILLLSVIALLGMTPGVQAATNVSGAITANTVWSLANSPYQVTADISVTNGATLSIEAGVMILFDTGRNLTLTSGAISARGTAGQPIIFTSSLENMGGAPAPGDWGQIRFLDATNDSTAILEYAQIRYGQGISVQAAAPTFNYLQLTQNLGSAISIDLSSSPKGVGNQATGNMLNGVSVPAGDVVGSITWGIKGIPYVVESGVVSIGNTPVISDINVKEIQQGETINANLSGSRLTGSQSVSFSNAGVTGLIQSGAGNTNVPIQMTASPTATLGAANITLKVDAGQPTLAGVLQVIQPQPGILSINPNSLYSDQAGKALTVTGKNFAADSVVRVDGADLTTTFTSASSLDTVLPALTAGNKSITVKQPDPLLSGGFLISKPAVLSVTVPPLSITPASVSQTLGVPINITVSIPFAAPVGGVTVSVASSATNIATVPASVSIAEGSTSASIPVTSIGSGIATITVSSAGFSSASIQLQVNAPPTLSITSAKLIDVVGNNFSLAINSSTTAGAGGQVVSLISSNILVATVPASVIIPAGAKTVNVQVTGLTTGTATITATGSGFVDGSVVITVRPITQSVSVSPLPVAIPPDSVARKVTLRLAAVDAIDHVFAVSVNDTTVATVGVASVTIPAGQISAQILVTGKKEGSASISLISPTLGTLLVPVYVTVEYAGINMSYGAIVGVVKESSIVVAPVQNSALVSSPNVGVAFGRYITGMVPNLLTIGTGPTIVTINGDGLQNVTSVNISPADGLTIGSFTANPDGKSLTVPITVAENAVTTLRQVIVAGATGQYKATSSSADRLLISMPVPEVTSVDPLFAVPGSSAMTLVVRGRNLQNAQSVSFAPSEGIVVAAPVASADGTQLSTTISIDASAIRGARVVQVTTPAGTSDGLASSFNTLTLVSQIQETISPISSPVVGLVKESLAPPATNQSYGLYTTMIGITKGSTISGVSPSVGALGDTITLTMTGNELQNVTAVQFNPNTGLTVGTPVIAADGKSLTLSVVVDATAPLGARSLKILAGTTALPFSSSDAAMFKVILPLATITSVEPIVIPIPSTALTLALNGSKFQSATEIRITPNAGITIANPPVINAGGTRATVSITVAAGAAAGARVVSIVTSAGESSLVPTVANTATLTSEPLSEYGPFSSPLVGLVKEVLATTAPAVSTSVATPIVGVVLEATSVAPTPVNMNVFQPSPLVGVLYGSAAFDLAPEGLLAGNNGVLTVTGIGLDAVTSATVNPVTGITLGALQASPDGTQLSIPVSVAVDATAGDRWFVLNRAGGIVNFANPSANNFWIATALPAFDSVTPNVGQQGSTLTTFTIRGTNLQNTTAIVAEPADGIIFGVPSVDASGTVITVGMVIDVNAPATPRVIRASTHGVLSSGVAVPANTFTVYP